MKKAKTSGSKEVTTIVSFRIAGKMKTDEDCFMGVVGAKNLKAAKEMTAADMKALLAIQNNVVVEDIELCGVWAEREEREKAAAAAEADNLTLYCYQIKGKMESDEHCFPAFIGGNLENATDDEIRKLIADGYHEPVENIELVGGDRAKKFQRRFGDHGEDLLGILPTVEDVLAPLT